MSIDRVPVPRRLFLGAALGGAVLVSACGSGPTTGQSTTRAKAYSSLAMLAEDSSHVVLGTVSGQRQESLDREGRDPYVVFDVNLEKLITSDAIGRSYRGAKPPVVDAGSTVTIMQWGSPDVKAADGAAFLEVGGTYLLFVLPTNLPNDSRVTGDYSAWFYNTGAYAGMYRSSGDGSYRRVLIDNIDTTPERISVDQVTQLG